MRHIKKAPDRVLFCFAGNFVENAEKVVVKRVVGFAKMRVKS